MLIKTSVIALKEVEKRFETAGGAVIPASSLFRADEQEVGQRRAHRSILFWRNHYSYSDCFNLVFFLFGL